MRVVIGTGSAEDSRQLARLIRQTFPDADITEDPTQADAGESSSTNAAASSRPATLGWSDEDLLAAALLPLQNPNPVFRFGAEGTVLFANAASQTLLATWHTGLGHAVPLEWQKVAKEALHRGKLGWLAVACGDRTIELSFTPIQTERCVNVYGRDETEHRSQIETDRAELDRLNHRLAAERDVLRAVMEHTETQLAYLDRDLNFVEVNTPYAIGSGHSREELIGRNHFDLFPNAENQAIFERVRDTGVPVEYRARPFEYADQPGRGVTYWDWTLRPVRDGTGEVRGLVLSLLDVTAKVQADREREGLLEEVQKQSGALAQANATLQSQAEELEVQSEELRAQNDELHEMMGRLQEALRRQSEARSLYQAVLENATAGVCVLDGEHLRVKFANAVYQQFLEEPYRSDDLTGERLQAFVPRIEESGLGDLFRRVAATREPHFDPEYQHYGFARGVTYWRWSLIPLPAGGDFPDLMILTTEITEQVLARKAAETAQDQAEGLAEQLEGERQKLELRVQERTAELQASRNQLQNLSRRLVTLHEGVRVNIAQHLYDDEGQRLAVLLVHLALLERNVEGHPAIKEHMSELKQLAESLLADLHRLAMDLRPASLDHLGLDHAVSALAEEFGRAHGLTAVVEASSLKGVSLPRDVETSVYRIIEEALENVARHAHASSVGVILSCRDGQITAIVEDNGVGFDPGAAMREGQCGLLSMQERAEMVNGSLTIESRPGAGTTVYVQVPYGACK